MLFDRIKRLVAAERYLVGQHAVERLDERGILEWQIIDGIALAQVLREKPNAEPNSAVEVVQILADGTNIKVVWSHVASIDVAKLVTVHFFDE